MPERLLIVTDVDNTLYDWVAIWAGAFEAMIAALVGGTGRGAGQWVEAVRAVHVRRAAIECPSTLSDVALATGWPASVEPAPVLSAAAAAYRAYWEQHLTPYHGVRAALTRLHEQGHAIVAYTEGDATVAATRLVRLGLAGVIRTVFGRPPLPASREPDWCLIGPHRSSPMSIDFVPREESKPNPAGLRRIMTRAGASAAQTVHIGDNLFKDVVMAQTLGVRAVWARYGAARAPAHAALLDRVAHWSPLDVAAERRTSPAGVKADVELNAPSDLPRALEWHGTSAVAL